MSTEEASSKAVDDLAVQLAEVLAKVEAIQKRAEVNAEWEQEWRDLRRREVSAREKQAAALAALVAQAAALLAAALQAENERLTAEILSRDPDVDGLWPLPPGAGEWVFDETDRVGCEWCVTRSDTTFFLKNAISGLISTNRESLIPDGLETIIRARNAASLAARKISL